MNLNSPKLLDLVGALAERDYKLGPEDDWLRHRLISFRLTPLADLAANGWEIPSDPMAFRRG